eukprot:47631-Pelagomonas_calceolata.AAC.3
MDICIQKWHLRFLKSILGVRPSTPSWSLLRECGIELNQFNWFRACARLCISLIHCNSPLLHKVLHSDISLGSMNSERQISPPGIRETIFFLTSPRPQQQNIYHHHWCSFPTKDTHVTCTYVLIHSAQIPVLVLAYAHRAQRGLIPSSCPYTLS